MTHNFLFFSRVAHSEWQAANLAYLEGHGFQSPRVVPTAGGDGESCGGGGLHVIFKTLPTLKSFHGETRAP